MAMPQKLALLIEYDGRAYHGFQWQANAVSVQGALETALKTINREDTRLKGASRTDTGVHALGQVVTFTTALEHSAQTYVAALNHYLPADIAVLDACVVHCDFDARRHARSRSYRYVVLNRSQRSPLAIGRAHWVRHSLDIDAMQDAAGRLIGQHDLASFSGPLSTQKITVRRITRAEVTGAAPFVFFDIEAEAFLPQQVRRTMGTLLAIGSGELGAETVTCLLESPRLGAAAVTAPPDGLYLTKITYPEGALSFSTGSGQASRAVPATIAALARD